MKQLHGGVEMVSRFAPEFLFFHSDVNGTNVDVLETVYEIPKNRALKIISVIGHAEASAAETVTMVHIEVYPVGMVPPQAVRLDHSPGGAAAVREVARFIPGNHAIIPGGFIIRFRAFFSAAVQAKSLDANIVGYLIHPPDKIL